MPTSPQLYPCPCSKDTEDLFTSGITKSSHGCMHVVVSQASIRGNTVHSMKNTQQADPLCPFSKACLLTLPPPLSHSRRVAGANETHCPSIPNMCSLLRQTADPKGRGADGRRCF